MRYNQKLGIWTLAATLSSLWLALASATSAMAQAWPAKPIKVIVPFGAGSAVDVVPRIALEQLSTQLGQPIIVENRAGAGSSTGTAIVAKAEPDGYTLLVTSSAYSVVPAIYQGLTYDPIADLAAVTTIGGSPSVVIVPTTRGFASIGELVAEGKAKPGSLNFASLGVGSATHMGAEQFRLSAGFEAAHVPFRSGAEALSEIIAGRIDYYFCPIGTALPMVKDGKVKALAIGSGKRASSLPDLPTTEEAGFKNSSFAVWYGLLAPAKTPAAIVQRLHEEMAAALKNPGVSQKYQQNGTEPMPMSSAEFQALIAREIEDNKKLAARLNLKPN